MRYLTLLFALILAGCSDVPAGHHTLTVQIDNVNQDGGKVWVMVFNDKEALMGTPELLSRAYSPAEAKNITLNNVPAGKYAIMSYQDHDNNGLLSITRLGMPTEPLGFSNNPTLQGPPGFDMVAFELTADSTRHISLFRYPRKSDRP